MVKQKSQYVCNDCGGTTPRWTGQCPHCKAWNSLAEELVEKQNSTTNRYDAWAGEKSKIMQISQIERTDTTRKFTKIEELDRVLGGGLTEGSVVLIGGDPGIGKSTLLLQVCNNLATTENKVLYISGEESLAQIASRSDRLNITNKNIDVLGEIQLEKIISDIHATRPSLVIIDSIQTVYTSELQAAPGTVSQVRECAAKLTRIAKSQNISLLLVGHVTKEGSLAGPRVLEHIVDTVLYFEGDPGAPFRMLRAIKNRFGSANELGLFTMTEKGLEDLSNPSELLITPHAAPVAGSTILASMEGNRPFLVEVQALVEESTTANPKRYASGMDTNKLQMILAILNKHASIASYDKNVYAQTTGGIRISEPGLDLAVALCAYSSLAKKVLPLNTAVFGELGLSGELRPVPNAETRLKECQKLGYKKIIMPERTKFRESLFSDMKIYRYSKLTDLLMAIKKGEIA